jgi:hypothetical protein
MRRLYHRLVVIKGSLYHRFIDATAASEFRERLSETEVLLNKATELLDEADTLYREADELSMSGRAADRIEAARRTAEALNKKSEANLITEKIEVNIRLLKGITGRWGVWSSLIIALSFIFLLIASPAVGNHIEKININFYIVIAQIIPVFLIAMSVYSLRKAPTKKEYVADTIGLTLPVLIGETGCLISIAANKPYAWSATAALYAIFSLIIHFCVDGYLEHTVEIKQHR